MQIHLLRLQNFRNFASAELRPHSELNVLFGDNGAGKTSLLEAIYLLARGKSFRTGRAEELIGPETDGFRIFLEVERGGALHRLGLERDARQWKARRDGQDVAVLSELSRDLPLVLMEPNSHELVSGAPEGRRRFVDWGVFHVEPTYLELWRRYSRALKQRNAALRKQDVRQLDALDAVLAPAGERLAVFRQRYVDRLDGAVGDALHDEKPALQGIRLTYVPGWRGDELLAALQRGRQRDLDRGVTSQGPHRADLDILRDGHPVRTLLSRGEQKGLAAALLLTQARLLAESGERPVILLDDVASEFDRPHLEKVLAQARACSRQLWVTGVERLRLEDAHDVFHVERGTIRKVV